LIDNNLKLNIRAIFTQIFYSNIFAKQNLSFIRILSSYRYANTDISYLYYLYVYIF